MEHPLHTISYVADIEGVLVIMAHLGPVLDPSSSPSTPDRVGVSVGSYTPKITCHVLDAENVSISTCGILVLFYVGIACRLD